MIKKFCPCCKRWFQPTKPGTIYCSPECYDLIRLYNNRYAVDKYRSKHEDYGQLAMKLNITIQFGNHFSSCAGLPQDAHRYMGLVCTDFSLAPGSLDNLGYGKEDIAS